MTTNTLNFEKLTPFQERTFVPNDANFSDISEVKVLFKSLIEKELDTKEVFEQWLLDRSELESILDQFGSILYIRMTCQTDDQERADDYKNFIETIVPVIKPLSDELNKKFVKTNEKFPLDQERYEIYSRSIATDIELFFQENVPIETEVDLLSQEYQKVCGAMTVEFEGRERTMPEMSKFVLEPDRSLRERAWKAIAQRRLKDKDQLEDIFDKMLKKRHKIAQNAGFKNYCDYKFKSMHRFDYTSDDCKKYHETVEELVLPVWNLICEKRKTAMGLDMLRPWDSAVDPLGRPPLKPFEQVDDLISGCLDIYNKVNIELGEQFKGMAQGGFLDLASRKGKAPGGYQSTLNESRRPFIFMNAVGTDDDIRTLLHEGGHAFHAIACSKDPLVDYRHGPMEFCEVASMSMELLGGEYIDVFYSDQGEAQRSRISHFQDIVFVLIWVAIIDSFQHWIYENPEHSRDERKEKWLSIRKRFGSQLVDWSGFEEEHNYLWHRQLHIFEVPFYYIEYGIAQLGALQVWLNAQKNLQEAITNYRKGLALGGSKGLPILFQTAGIKFDFSSETIGPLMDAVLDELKKLKF